VDEGDRATDSEQPIADDILNPGLYVHGNMARLQLNLNVSDDSVSGNACYIRSSRPLSRNVKVKIYKTVILPVVVYGYETWSLTLTEEHRLRAFENRVLRRIFGPKRDEVRGE
jgi:hypothetical protein